MSKPYVERNSDPVLQPVSVNVDVSEPKEDLGSDLGSNSFGPTDTTRLTNTDVLRNLDSKLSHLSDIQHQDLEKLLLEIEHLFPVVPTRTDQIYHEVDVGNADPIKQHPYRLNPSKQKYLKEEIKYLLENDFIEPCNSSYCILVPKPDGSYRMCTDYRKVNSVTTWLRVTTVNSVTRFLSCGWKTALINWEKLNTWRRVTFSKDSGKFD